MKDLFFSGPPAGADGEHDWVLYLCLLAIVVMLSMLLALPSLKKGRSVMIMGPEDSGKTTLWMRLKDGRAANVAAIVPTVFFKDEAFDIELPRLGGAMPPRELVDVIDAPSDGDAVPRIMGKLSRLAAIVFVVDLADESSWEAAADLLYRLFTADAMRKARTPLLIACNKADASEASVERLRAALEAGVHSLQLKRTEEAKGRVVEGQGLGPEVTMIHTDGQPFTFGKVRPAPSARARPRPSPPPPRVARGALTARPVAPARGRLPSRRPPAPSRWSSAARCSRRRRRWSSSCAGTCPSSRPRPGSSGARLPRPRPQTARSRTSGKSSSRRSSGRS